MALFIGEVSCVGRSLYAAAVVDVYTIAYAAYGVDAASAVKAAQRVIDNQSKVGTLINRCAEPEAALRPFAAYGASLDQRLPDTALVTSGLRSPTAKLSVGECRSAAAVLAKGRASK